MTLLFLSQRAMSLVLVSRSDFAAIGSEAEADQLLELVLVLDLLVVVDADLLPEELLVALVSRERPEEDLVVVQAPPPLSLVLGCGACP